MGNTHVGFYRVPRGEDKAKGPEENTNNNIELSFENLEEQLRSNKLRSRSGSTSTGVRCNLERCHEIINRMTSNARLEQCGCSTYHSSPTFGGLPSSDEIIIANLKQFQGFDSGNSNNFTGNAGHRGCYCTQDFNKSSHHFGFQSNGASDRWNTNFGSSDPCGAPWKTGNNFRCPTFGGLPSSDDIINTNLKNYKSTPDWDAPTVPNAGFVDDTVGNSFTASGATGNIPEGTARNKREISADNPPNDLEPHPKTLVNPEIKTPPPIAHDQQVYPTAIPKDAVDPKQKIIAQVNPQQVIAFRTDHNLEEAKDADEFKPKLVAEPQQIIAFHAEHNFEGPKDAIDIKPKMVGAAKPQQVIAGNAEHDLELPKNAVETKPKMVAEVKPQPAMTVNAEHNLDDPKDDDVQPKTFAEIQPQQVIAFRAEHNLEGPKDAADKPKIIAEVKPQQVIAQQAEQPNLDYPKHATSIKPKIVAEVQPQVMALNVEHHLESPKNAAEMKPKLAAEVKPQQVMASNAENLQGPRDVAEFKPKAPPEVKLQQVLEEPSSSKEAAEAKPKAESEPKLQRVTSLNVENKPESANGAAGVKLKVASEAKLQQQATALNAEGRNTSEESSAYPATYTVEIPARNPGGLFLLKSEFDTFLNRYSETLKAVRDVDGQPDQNPRTRSKPRPYVDVFPPSDSPPRYSTCRIAPPPPPPKCPVRPSATPSKAKTCPRRSPSK